MGTRVERVVRDPRFERLVPPTAELVHLADGAIWAEGPVYVPDEDAVLWSDVPGNVVRRWSAADGPSEHLRPSDFANGHTLDRDGRVLACEHGPRRVARYEPDGSRSTVVDRFEGRRLNSPNDLVVASDGAIWFSDPPYGILDDREGYKADSELGACNVFRFDPGERRADDRLRRPDPPERPGLLARRARAVRVGHLGRADRGRQPPHRRLRRDRRTARSRRPGCSRSSSPASPTASGSTSRATCGPRPATASTSSTTGAPSSGGSCVPEPAGNCTFGGADGRRLFITATTTLWAIDVGIRGAVTPWVEGG